MDTALQKYSEQHSWRLIMAEPVEPESSIGLLDVPPELRIKIYRNLLVVGEIDLYWNQIRRGRVENSKVATSSQILQVCKTTFTEGLPILYGENIFQAYMGNSKHRHSLFKLIGARGQALIKHFMADCEMCSSKSAAIRFKPFHALQTFKVVLAARTSGNAPSEDLFSGSQRWSRKDRDFPSESFLQELLCYFPGIELEAVMSYRHETTGSDNVYLITKSVEYVVTFGIQAVTDSQKATFTRIIDRGLFGLKLQTISQGLLDSSGPEAIPVE
ncbi:hypothetical protein EJ08DRAFT_692365 [Tothia fuscella]|uniref:Uncharacterized protein n=1 Tax=Tothia fuscella TaxID=1048955 RepID=A0A9P4U476_9PEZI|nr:hypothetical protein EJ08DRAFT_692365 [Tothia fuscella]